MRSACDYLSHKADGDYLKGLRLLCERCDWAEAQRNLSFWRTRQSHAWWLERWQGKCPKLCQWV